MTIRSITAKENLLSLASVLAIGNPTMATCWATRDDNVCHQGSATRLDNLPQFGQSVYFYTDSVCFPKCEALDYQKYGYWDFFESEFDCTFNAFSIAYANLGCTWDPTRRYPGTGSASGCLASIGEPGCNEP